MVMKLCGGGVESEGSWGPWCTLANCCRALRVERAELQDCTYLMHIVWGAAVRARDSQLHAEETVSVCLAFMST